MKKFGFKTAFALSVGILSIAAHSAEMELASPESQGISSDAILKWIEACEIAATNGMLKGFMHGFVIVRHGKTIAEGTWAPYDTLTRPHMLYSHSKSFTSTAVGFLVDDGMLDLDERIISIFPDRTPSNPSENLRQMRVRDLLTMNVGARFTDAERKDINGDWVRAFLHNEVESPPGTVFKYDSCATHMLAAIVEKRTGKPLMEFLRERLFKPLGMTSPWSTTSPTGVACGGWGMNMTTRDLARFGQFMLQEGCWGDRQLLSREWVRMASARQTWSGSIVVQSKTIGSGSDWNQGYGFQFWRNRNDSYRADGAAGQITIVLPVHDAVVSINAGLGNMQNELNLVWEHLLPAFESSPLPAAEASVKALRRKCDSLALPLEDSRKEAFLDMNYAKVENAADGWKLVKGERMLSVGNGEWAITRWKFSDSNVEPLFSFTGTHDIAASGRITPDGQLEVVWHFLGGIKHGTFAVEMIGE